MGARIETRDAVQGAGNLVIGPRISSASVVDVEWTPGNIPTLSFCFPYAAAVETLGAVSRYMSHRLLMIFLVGLCIAASCLTGCQTLRHHFLAPSHDWQARSGQLLYRGKRTTLIGEVLVRFSKAGDFELTFTKGPGFILLELRQDANFASVKGPLARGSWSGPNAQAPTRLEAWLELRKLLMDSPNKASIRHTAGAENFEFRF